MQGGGKSHGELEKHSSGKRSSFDSQGGFDRSIGGGKNKTGPTFSQPSGNRTFDSTKKGRPDARFQSGSLDGNTVDPQLEHAAFGQAALEYQATLSFMEGKVRSLMTAITGE